MNRECWVLKQSNDSLNFIYVMKRITIVFFFLLEISLGASVLRAQTTDPYLPDSNSPASINGMKLMWNDEFNINGAPNTSYWKPETGFVRNQELQYYQLKNTICTGGVLLITGKRDTVLNTKYVRGSTDWRYKDSLAYWTSASLITQGLKTFQYGRIDVRARIDTTYGAWPAIWQKGITGSWPACGEVDVLEFYNKKIYANAIFGAVGAANYTKCVSKSFSSVSGSDTNWAKKFHLWTEVWTADSIKLYLDGALMNSVLVANIVNPAGTTPANGFQQSHFFLLNLAIGSNGGTPRAKTSQITFEVDYIRVYQNTNTDNPALKNAEISIYPNPANDILNIRSENEIDQVVITDMLGKEVLCKNHPQNQISVSNLKSGIYIARIISVDGDIYQRNIIKK